MKPTQAGVWTVILAGGVGKRLRPLTIRVAGDARPKQYCAVWGGAAPRDVGHLVCPAELRVDGDRKVRQCSSR